MTAHDSIEIYLTDGRTWRPLIGEFAEIEDNTELIAAVEAHVEAVEQVLAEQARRDGLDLPDFPPTPPTSSSTRCGAADLRDHDRRRVPLRLLVDADEVDQSERLLAKWAEILPLARREQHIAAYVSRVHDGMAIAGEPQATKPVARLMAMVDAHIDAQ